MAFPIPSLPTDNLYKFIALTGLFVGVSSVFFMEIQVERNRKTVATLTAQVDYKKYVVDKLESKTGNSLSNDQKLGLLAKLITEEKKIIEKLAESKTDLDITKKRLRPIRLISLLGFIASIIGFCLWYRRVQKPLDEILQLNLEKTRLEASSREESSKA